MDCRDFLTALEDYYGPYQKPFVGKMVMSYLQKNFTEDQLPELMILIMKKYGNQYKTPPDIAAIEALRNDSEIRAEKAWQFLLSKSSGDDVLITDPVLHSTVASWGNWDNFCQARDGEYKELAHRDFIKRFVMFSESRGDLGTPHVLRGALTVLYGPMTSVSGSLQERKPVIIGDEKLGRALLEALNSGDSETNKMIQDFTKDRLLA